MRTLQAIAVTVFIFSCLSINLVDLISLLIRQSINQSFFVKVTLTLFPFRDLLRGRLGKQAAGGNREAERPDQEARSVHTRLQGRERGGEPL